MENSIKKLLGVNIDHIATIRQARGTRYPEPLQAALVAEQAGADIITLHLREDRRHIQDRDVRLLADITQTRVNLEMAATDEMLDIALSVRPADCCLVPEKREELTTEGGLDVAAQKTSLTAYCAALADAGIRVSLFVDADPQQIEAAAKIGAPVVELHTGRYAQAVTEEGRQAELAKISNAAKMGSELGLRINAGHGLDYHNVQAVAAIYTVEELNIGHSIVARALFSGLHEAVRDMKRLIGEVV